MKSRLILVVVGFFLATTGANAQAGPGNITAKNATGAIVPLACQLDINLACHYRDVLEGLLSSDHVTPTASTIDSIDSGLWVHMLNPPNYTASGVTPVSTSISSATVSAQFVPVAGRLFHVTFPAGTGVATCQLERKLDGTNWVQYTVNGSPFYTISYSGLSVSEDVIENQTSVLYRMDCGGGSNGSYSSGTITIEFTQ